MVYEINSTPPSYSSPIMSEKEQLEIIMGGIVRPASPERKTSIEVPGIILTEPQASRGNKQILLLSPVLLPLPSPSTSGSHGSGAAGWLRRRTTVGGGSVVKAVVLLGAVALGIWHLCVIVNSAHPQQQSVEA